MGQSRKRSSVICSDFFSWIQYCPWVPGSWRPNASSNTDQAVLWLTWAGQSLNQLGLAKTRQLCRSNWKAMSCILVKYITGMCNPPAKNFRNGRPTKWHFADFKTGSPTESNVHTVHKTLAPCGKSSYIISKSIRLCSCAWLFTLTVLCWV